MLSSGVATENGCLIENTSGVLLQQEYPEVQKSKPLQEVAKDDISQKMVVDSNTHKHARPIRRKKKRLRVVEEFDFSKLRGRGRRPMTKEGVLKRSGTSELPVYINRQEIKNVRKRRKKVQTVKQQITVPYSFNFHRRTRRILNNGQTKTTGVTSIRDNLFKEKAVSNTKSIRAIPKKYRMKITVPRIKRLATDIRAEQSFEKWEKLKRRAMLNVERRRKQLREKEKLREQKKKGKSKPFKVTSLPDFGIAHRQEKLRLKQAYQIHELTIPVSPYFHQSIQKTKLN